MNRSLRPDGRHQLAHHARLRAAVAPSPNVSIGSAMIWPTVMRGSSDAYGILEDHLHVAALRAAARAATARRGRAAKTTRPPVGSTSRSIARPSVVLPQPDSPTSPSVSPAIDIERHAVHRLDDTAPRCARDPIERTGADDRSAPSDRERTASGCVASDRGHSSACASHRPPSREVAERLMLGRQLRRTAGTRSRQIASARSHRGANGQPGGSRATIRRQAGNLVQRRRDVARRDRAPTAAGPSCRDCRGRANSSAVGALSNTRPAYITMMRSVMPATTPRSCVIRITLVPVSCLQRPDQVEDLRLDRDVERRRRLVGDQQFAAGTTAPSRSSRAAACRRRTRADSRRRAARIRDADRAPASAPRARRPRSRVCPRCSRVTSISCCEIRMNGFSDVIGSWKIIAIRLPRIARISSAGSVSRSRPSKSDLAGDDAAGRRRDEPHDRQVRHRLARARLADDAERLAAIASKLTPSTALTVRSSSSN